jgi:predicted DNA-binding WGR domain protein
MKKTLQYKDEKSDKFWTIETNGNEFTVTFGKTGTDGQSQTKSFADEAACLKEAEKLIREKTKKGYAEQGGIETPETLDEIFELALNNDKYISLFIDYHRGLCGDGDEVATIEQLLELLSDTDNGLRLLAACCVYVIDNQDIEFNLENWFEEHIGDDPKKQEKLFKYMLMEAVEMKKDKFLLHYFCETLDVMGIEYDKKALEALLNAVDVKNLPKLSAISTGKAPKDVAKEAERAKEKEMERLWDIEHEKFKKMTVEKTNVIPTQAPSELTIVFAPVSFELPAGFAFEKAQKTRRGPNGYIYEDVEIRHETIDNKKYIFVEDKEASILFKYKDYNFGAYLSDSPFGKMVNGLGICQYPDVAAIFQLPNCEMKKVSAFVYTRKSYTDKLSANAVYGITGGSFVLFATISENELADFVRLASTVKLVKK